MKTVIESLLLVLLFTLTSVYAEDVTMIETKSSEISNNLDLN